MNDLPCPATGCNGGMISIPKIELDKNGKPMIIQDIITCIVCGGNGRVQK